MGQVGGVLLGAQDAQVSLSPCLAEYPYPLLENPVLAREKLDPVQQEVSQENVTQEKDTFPQNYTKQPASVRGKELRVIRGGERGLQETGAPQGPVELTGGTTLHSNASLGSVSTTSFHNY